ncbi:MAG: MarR family transcriptional regulator [Rhodocyclales bacterium]|nr:MarR family transcriptional regulator [Rhodocyclales bacterium]
MRERLPAPETNGQPLRQAILAVRRLFHALAGTAGRAHADLGITASMRAVLETLHERGPRTVPQVARGLDVSRQHIQVVVNGLLEGGLVECLDNPDHLRSPIMRLTMAGTKACEAIRRREARLLAELAKRIPGADLKVTLKTLDAMESGLNRQETRAGSRV